MEDQLDSNLLARFDQDRTGPAQRAVEASMTLPGIFTPVELDGRFLINGGSNLT